ncbi:MAG: DUF1232 domain-containing protein [Chloroflexota bacterium]
MNNEAMNKDPGFWRELWQQARLVWLLLRDPEIPFYLKIVPLLALIYIIVPIDLSPDWLPLLGQLDDLTALLVGAKVFIELSPPEVVARHLATLRQQKVAGLPDPAGAASDSPSLEEAIVIDPDRK